MDTKPNHFSKIMYACARPLTSALTRPAMGRHSFTEHRKYSTSLEQNAANQQAHAHAHNIIISRDVVII